MDTSVSEGDLKELCTAIGIIAINWAMIERQLDNCIHLICADLGGIPGEREKPLALERKIKALKKSFRRIESLKPFKDRAIPLIEDARVMGHKRHMFLHGCIGKLEGPILTMHKLRPDINALNPYYEVEELSFDFTQFPALVEDLSRLVKAWGFLAKDLLDTIERRHPKPLRPHLRGH